MEGSIEDFLSLIGSSLDDFFSSGGSAEIFLSSVGYSKDQVITKTSAVFDDIVSALHSIEEPAATDILTGRDIFIQGAMDGRHEKLQNFTEDYAEGTLAKRLNEAYVEMYDYGQEFGKLISVKRFPVYRKERGDNPIAILILTAGGYVLEYGKILGAKYTQKVIEYEPIGDGTTANDRRFMKSLKIGVGKTAKNL